MLYVGQKDLGKNDLLQSRVFVFNKMIHLCTFSLIARNVFVCVFYAYCPHNHVTRHQVLVPFLSLFLSLFVVLFFFRCLIRYLTKNDIDVCDKITDSDTENIATRQYQKYTHIILYTVKIIANTYIFLQPKTDCERIA